MDMRNNKRRNGLTHVRVNFSQSETSSLLHEGGGGGVGILVTTAGEGGVYRKDPYQTSKLDRLLSLRWNTQWQLNPKIDFFKENRNNFELNFQKLITETHKSSERGPTMKSCLSSATFLSCNLLRSLILGRSHKTHWVDLPLLFSKWASDIFSHLMP